MNENYQSFARAMEGKGYFTLYGPKCLPPVVYCATRRRDNGDLTGTSYKVFLHKNIWCVETWAPVFYWLPPGTELNALVELCESLLQRRHCMWEIDQDLVTEYSLRAMFYDGYFLLFLEALIPQVFASLKESQQLYKNRFGTFAQSVEQLIDSGVADEFLHTNPASKSFFDRDLAAGYRLTLTRHESGWLAVVESDEDPRVFQMDATGNFQNCEKSLSSRANCTD